MSKPEDRKKLKKTILQEMKALKAPKNCSSQQAIESLVKQADHYAKFLLSRFEPPKEGEDDDSPSFTRLQEQPSCLVGGKLKYYQLVALNWMISLYESGISGILADDMGLGKTIQTISLLSFLREFKHTPGPHLIIAPNSTLGNWTRELSKWLPAASALKLPATKTERELGLTTLKTGHFDIVITSFQGVRLALPELKKIQWQYLIIDQAHKIKNEASQLSQVVRKLHTECKLLLTGTPLQNNLHELWALMNFLLPEIFDSSELFDNWLDSPQEEDHKETETRNAQMIAQLHKILRPFMLRRTKAQVEKTLPGKKEIHIYVGLSELQLKLYRSLLTNRSAGDEDKRLYLNLLMQLRKVCCHPYLFPGVEPTDAPPVGEHLVTASGKLMVLDRLLEKLHREGGHKILIFSQMTMVLNILEDYCHLRSYTFCRIDGATDMPTREAQIESFTTSPRPFLFLLSTRAGGLGINLTAADTVVIYDSDFNPQMDLQAMDRAHRIGQQREVRVYRLVTQDTVQEKIIERQMIKLKWDSLVIQQQRQKPKNLTKEEMKDMLQFGANAIFKATAPTLSEQLIEELLDRGEAKTQALAQQVKEQMKMPNDIAQLNIDSINIFDFMQRDEERKRRDAQTLEAMAGKEPLLKEELRGRREKPKQVRTKIDKKVTLAEHHFYPQRERLRALLQKEEDWKNNRGMEECPPLTETEEEEKLRLLGGGFREWNKTDFNSFVTASEKWGRNCYAEIAQAIGKTPEAVQTYAEVFWRRLDEVGEADRIRRQVDGGEQRLASRRQQWSLLQWKKDRTPSIDFNSVIYTKFKSKLFSIEADRFLAETVHALGPRSMLQVKERIREEPIFRFDHYFRSRGESDLNKRMVSVYKLIEKERDNEMYGLENDREKNKRVRGWDCEAGGRRDGKKKSKRE